MRTAALALLTLLPLVGPPVASAELQDQAIVIGGTTGTTSGIVLAQVNEDTGVGVKYWRNATGPETASVVLLVCARSDAGQGSCEPLHLHA